MKLDLLMTVKPLYTVGITDGDGDIRYCVLDNLSLSFDYHLAQEILILIIILSKKYLIKRV